MLMMIDNYDSFTFNLVQYLGELGEELKVVRNDKISIAEIKEISPKAIIISPGPCTPNEAGVSLEIVEKLAGVIPIFGVCLGHQTIIQAFGGKIIRASSLMHGKTSQIYHDGNAVFAGIHPPYGYTLSFSDW